MSMCTEDVKKADTVYAARGYTAARDNSAHVRCRLPPGVPGNLENLEKGFSLF